MEEEEDCCSILPEKLKFTSTSGACSSGSPASTTNSNLFTFIYISSS